MTKEQANREEFWRQALKRRADSGMTIEAFCAQEGLKSTTYHYWQRELKRRDGKRQSPKNRPAGKLVPVQLVGDGSCQSDVEVVAKNGYVVRIGEQATADHVRRVLRAVSELS